MQARQIILLSAALIAAVALAIARPQTAATPDHKEPGEKQKQLVSVTFNLLDFKLRWDLAEGTVDDKGEFRIDKLLGQQEINPDEATMTVNGETRKFSEREASSLRRMLATLARYCAESTIWFEEGNGEPVNKPGRIAGVRP
jgi:hypothetical protein